MKYLRIAFILTIAAAIIFIGGCAVSKQGGGEDGGSSCPLFSFLDWFFAPSPTGTAPFQLLGMGLNVLIPGAGTLLGLGGTAWAALRAGKWKRAFTATAQVIESGAELGMSAQDLKPHLADAHAIANVDTLVHKIITRIEPDEVTEATA